MDSPRFSRQRTWVVDRIEGTVAALETDGERLIHLPLDLLPSELREGDVLLVRYSATPGDARIEFERDESETAARRGRLEERVRALSATDPGGDLEI